MISGISPADILNKYDIKRDQKISYRDLVAGKGESRTPEIYEPTKDANYDSPKKVSLLSTDRENDPKVHELDNKIERLAKKFEPVEFAVTPTVTRLVTSDGETEVMENHEKDFDEEQSSPQSTLQIDEREELIISPELPS